LLTGGEAADVLPVKTNKVHQPSALPNQFLTIVLGTLVSLGFELGCREMLEGLSLLFGGITDALVLSSFALASRSVSIALGALIAGAGRTGGYGLGLLVGALASTFWLGWDSLNGTGSLATVVGMITCPLLGLALGHFGSIVWPAPIALPKPQNQAQSSLLKVGDGPPSEKNERPTQWLRVVIASAIIVFVPIVASFARQSLAKMPASLMESLSDPAVLPRTECQVAGLILMISGIIAGASTKAGLRHGALAGIIGTTAMLGVTSIEPAASERLFTYVAKLCQVEPGTSTSYGVVALGSLGVVLASSWLGSQLFPPIVRRERRRR
jgi:hypothetical protein